MWNEDLGEWQLKCVAYSGNNMRKQKENDTDKNKPNVDYDHLFLSYTAEGAEKAMQAKEAKEAKEAKRAKSAKNKRKHTQR